MRSNTRRTLDVLLVLLIGFYWLLPDDIYRLTALTPLLKNPLNQYSNSFNVLGLQPNGFDVGVFILSIVALVRQRRYFRRTLSVIGIIWVMTWLVTFLRSEDILVDSILWFLLVFPPALALVSTLDDGWIRNFLEIEFLILTVAALGAFAMGSAGMGVGKRLNAPGLSPNTSTVVFGNLVILGCIPSKGLLRWRGWRLIEVGLGAIALILSGSRIGLLTTVLTILSLLVALSFFRGKVEGLMLLQLITILILVGFWIISVIGIEVVADTRWGELLRLSDSVSALGRLDSLTKGWYLVQQYPLGLGNSDWLVQGELQKLGYPTFVHSAIFEFYLRLGPIILVVFLIFISTLVRMYMYWPPRWEVYLAINLVAREIFSYGFWNIKYSTIALAVLFVVWFKGRTIRRRRFKYVVKARPERVTVSSG